MELAEFSLGPVAEKDVSEIVPLWYFAFNSPAMRKLFPDTPGVRQWWHENIHTDLHLKAKQRRYMKIVENDAIIAYAKWDLSSVEELEDRFLPWHSDMDAEACDQLATHCAQQRDRVTECRRHYYLDMLATHPAHQGKGAASALLRWGCERADCDRVYIYVDASRDGLRLYEKFGFVDHSLPGDHSGLVPMMRSPSTPRHI